MNPLIYVGIILLVFTTIFVVAYLLIKDKKEAFGFDRNMKDSEITKRLLKYAKSHAKVFIIVFVIMAFTVAADIILPLITASIIKTLQRKGGFEYSEVLTYVLLYISLLLLSLVSAYIQSILLQKTGQRIVSKIREDLFTHIESLSANQLNHIPVGKLVTRVANDTNAVSMMFTNLIVNLIKNACLVIGYVVAMLILNIKLALLVLAFVPFILLFTYIFRKFSRKAYRKVKNTTTDINTYLSENLSGIKVTQIFNQEDRKLKEFEEKNEALGKAKQGQIWVFSIFRPTVYMLYVLNILLLFWVAGTGILDNVSFLGQTIDVFTLIAFYSYIGSFFTPVQNLAEQFNWLQSAFASSEKIFTILDMVPEIVDEKDAIELDKINGEIEFKDVWFAYNEGEWILKGISFKILPKQTIALVGSTGSGKTTILSLLVRNYDIQKGQILIDGQDIRSVNRFR